MRSFVADVGYWTARCFFFVLRIVPMPVGYWITDRVAGLAYRIDGKRRRRGFRNVTHCFGDRSEAERNAIVKACYRNLLRVGFETLHAGPLIAGDYEKVIEVEGREHLEAVRNGGVLLSGHVGNWEVAGIALCRLIGPIFSVAKAVEQGPFERYLRQQREVCGQRVISFKGAVDRARAILTDGERIGFVGDQHGRVNRIWTPFFGMPAAYVKTPATLARRYGYPVSMCFCTRVGPGFRFRLVITPPVHPDPDRPVREDVARIIQTFSQRLEACIRERPGDYLWLHQRWRAAQDGEEYIGEDGTYVRRHTFGSERAPADSDRSAKEPGSA